MKAQVPSLVHSSTPPALPLLPLGLAAGIELPGVGGAGGLA